MIKRLLIKFLFTRLFKHLTSWYLVICNKWLPPSCWWVVGGTSLPPCVFVCVYTISWATAYINTLSKVFLYAINSLMTLEKRWDELSENEKHLKLDVNNKRHERIRHLFAFIFQKAEVSFTDWVSMNFQRSHTSVLPVIVLLHSSLRATDPSSQVWIYLQRPTGVYLPSFVCTSNYCLWKVLQTTQGGSHLTDPDLRGRPLSVWAQGK